MSVVPNPSFPTIPDYVPPVDFQPDDDIIVGPSIISLKCPISFSRIKIPIKGHSCKHLQCFDFNNYVGLNSKTPLWHCPQCSRSVCFSDIRIDQSMVKVLKEVGEDVSYVKISGHGSWQAVTENISNEHTEKRNDAGTSNQETSTQNCDDIMDLTENDNEMDIIDKDDVKKPSPAGKSSVMNKDIAPQTEDGFWREFYSSTPGTRTTNTRSDVCDAIQRNYLMFNPLTQGQSQSLSLSQIPVLNNMQSQQNENTNNNRNGHVRYPTSTAWIRRTQNTIQPLPPQNSATTVDGDSQQNFSRYHLNPYMNSQNKGQHDHLLLSSQSQTSPQVGARSVSPQLISGSHQVLNQMAQLPVRTSGQPSPRVRPGGEHGGVGTMTSLASSQSHMHSLDVVRRATSKVMSQSPSILSSTRTSGPSLGPVAATADQRGSSADALAEENWRPTGRMRGSLTGWQYTEALKNQFIIQPSQPVQAARPPPVLNTPRPFIPPHLQALMANNPRPQAGGNGPGSGSGPGPDSRMAGGPGSDK